MARGVVAASPRREQAAPSGFVQSRQTVIVSLCVLGVVVLMYLHYSAALHRLGLHDALRRLFYLPVIVAAIVGGRRGGLMVAGLAVVGYIPHLFQLARADDRIMDSVFELVLLLLVGVLVGAFADSSRRARGLAAERGRLAALGETGLALMAQTEGPLAAIDGQAESLGLLAGRGRDGAVGFAAGVIHEEVAQARRMFGDLRELVTSLDQRQSKVDLAPLASGVVVDLMRTSRTENRLSLGRVARGCCVLTDRRALTISLRSLISGLLETVPLPGWLEVSVLESRPEEGIVEVAAFSAGEVLPNLERSLTRVFGAGAKEYRFRQVFGVHVLASLGADVTFHHVSKREALVRIHFQRIPDNRRNGHARDAPSSPQQPTGAG
jgi:hypothetical protein